MDLVFPHSEALPHLYSLLLDTLHNINTTSAADRRRSGFDHGGLFGVGQCQERNGTWHMQDPCMWTLCTESMNMHMESMHVWSFDGYIVHTPHYECIRGPACREQSEPTCCYSLQTYILYR